MEGALAVAIKPPAADPQNEATRSSWWHEPRLRTLLPLCTLLLFIRQPANFLNPQFWAEDGKYFFTDARNEGAASLGKLHKGTPYLYHRLVAYTGTFVPVAYAPHLYIFATLAATLAVIAFVARSQGPTRWRALLCLAVVAAPHSGEVFMNLTNTHWILGIGLLTLLVSNEPSTHRRSVLEAAVCVPLCLTGPFGLVFLPLFALRALARRSRHSVLLLAIALAAGGYQLLHLDANRTTGTLNLLDPNWRGVLGNSLSGVLLLGPKVPRDFPNNPIFVALSILLYGVLVGYAVTKCDVGLFTILAAGLLVLLATAYAHRGDPESLSINFSGRYYYIPIVTLLWALTLVLNASGSLRRFAIATLSIAAIGTALDFDSISRKDYHWRLASRGIGGPEPCSIPINPLGWFVHYKPTAEEASEAPLWQEVRFLLNAEDGPDPDAVRGIPGDPTCGSSFRFTLDKPRFVYAVRITVPQRNKRNGEEVADVSWRSQKTNPWDRAEESSELSFELGSSGSTLWTCDWLHEARVTFPADAQRHDALKLGILVKATDPIPLVRGANEMPLHATGLIANPGKRR